MFKKMISTIKSANIKHISYNSNIQKYIRNIGDTPIKKLNDNLKIISKFVVTYLGMN